MSKFSEQQKNKANTDLAMVELTMRQKQIELQYRDNCLQYAIRTAPEVQSALSVGNTPSKRPANPDEIIATAKKYYEFLNSMD